MRASARAQAKSGLEASDERRSARLECATGAPAFQIAGGANFGYQRPIAATPRRIEYNRSDAIVIERLGRTREGGMKVDGVTGADANVLGMVRLRRAHHREHGRQQEQAKARHDQSGRTSCAMLGPLLHQRASRRMASEDVCETTESEMRLPRAYTPLAAQAAFNACP